MPSVDDWEEWQYNFIRENYAEIGPSKCAKLLGKTYNAVQWRARKLGLKMYESRPWTPSEIVFLKENYPTKLGKYCAQELKRSFHAVHKKVGELGIKPSWTYQYTNAQGYVVLCEDRENKEYKHRRVMEQKLGRKLTPEELVHHKDENKQNNDPGNLELTSRPEHIEIHRETLLRAQGKQKR